MQCWNSAGCSAGADFLQERGKERDFKDGNKQEKNPTSVLCTVLSFTPPPHARRSGKHRHLLLLINLKRVKARLQTPQGCGEDYRTSI